MAFTKQDLERLGYRLQPDGSYARPEAADCSTPKRLSHTQPKCPIRQTLGSTAQGEAACRASLIVRVTRKACSLLDADNFAGGCKPLIDQLRYQGLIPNDDPGSIDLVFRQEKVNARAAQGTIVEILQK
jgi:hypothetical protein